MSPTDAVRRAQNNLSARQRKPDEILDGPGGLVAFFPPGALSPARLMPLCSESHLGETGRINQSDLLMVRPRPRQLKSRVECDFRSCPRLCVTPSVTIGSEVDGQDITGRSSMRRRYVAQRAEFRPKIANFAKCPIRFSRPPPSTTRPSLRVEILAKIRAIAAPPLLPRLHVSPEV
jgi:hypothetical protein